MRVVLAFALGLVLAGCGLIPGFGGEELAGAGAEPGAMPLGEDMQPIGPITDLGRGIGTVNGAWRYEVYTSRIGTCTRVVYIATGLDGGTACGGGLRLEPLTAAISLRGYGTSTETGWTIEGIVSDEVDAAWIELRDGERLPAEPLMPTDAVGGLGRVFYVEVPAGQVPVSAVATNADGDVIGEAPID